MEKLKDGTPVYSYEEAKEVYKNLAVPKIMADEAILLLLASTRKPIFGRTVMIKELFLLQEEVLKKHFRTVDDMRFVPYRYGPYSFRVAQLLEEMESIRLIERRGRKGTNDEKFSISERGMQHFSRIINKMPPEVLEEIRARRMGWDELGRDGLLRYVYQHYPEYKERSELKEKYKEITWGRGRG
ncbi:MAG: hypothetical protein QHH00_08345 [Methanomassiliicoccales archaeon]|jgi:uncharacterized protein YwgA|nr:hypothetical protein [Methanomassiliicoccales archaeon]